MIEDQLLKAMVVAMIEVSWRARRRLAGIAMTLVILAGAIVPAVAQSPDPIDPPPLAAERRVVLRVLTEGDYPPFNYYDEEGVLTGFNVDLARALCLEMNVACDIQVKPWEELLTAVARGETDAVMAAHVVSAKTLKTVDFTDRYFHTAARFAARRDGQKFEITPDGVEGKRVAVTKGTAHEAYLAEFFRLGRIQTFDTPELARDALAQNKVDLLFDDGIGLALWINGTASKECCELRGGPFLEPRYFGEGIAIAVPKADQKLRSDLNTALKRVRASGRFDEIVLQYFRTRLY
jgi:polar amino acid transport system substrate-binding protein